MSGARYGKLTVRFHRSPEDYLDVTEESCKIPPFRNTPTSTVVVGQFGYQNDAYRLGSELPGGGGSFYGVWQLSFNFYAVFASEFAAEERLFRASAGASESCLPQPAVCAREGLSDEIVGPIQKAVAKVNLANFCTRERC